MTQADGTTRLQTPQAQAQDNQPTTAGPGMSVGVEEAQGDMPASRVGTRVGPYLITKRLGEGGVGAVYKGVDEMLKREVAVKVLHPEFAADPLFVARFKREAQLHAKLSHPNVATVHAFLQEGDTQFMVMEYVPGISLDEFVRAGGPVPLERALAIFRRALDGIAHAHRQGIVHRDIKPANIMLADSGAVKVMDFGIARALDNSHEQLTRHGQVAGTAKAMAPEQIRGGEADVRSDIYSLGIVLFTMLAGRAPFDAETDFALMKAQLEQAPPPLRPLAPEVPAEVEAAVMKALQKDPAARFQSVTEFARALDAWQVTDATAALPPARAAASAQTMARTAVNPALAAGGTPAARAAGAPASGPAAAAAAAASAAAADAAAASARPSPKPDAPRAREGATTSATSAFAAFSATDDAPDAGAGATFAAGASREAAPPKAKAARGAALRRWRPGAHRGAIAGVLGVVALVGGGVAVGPRLVDALMPTRLPPLHVLTPPRGTSPVPSEVGPPVESYPHATAAASPADMPKPPAPANPASFAAAVAHSPVGAAAAAQARTAPDTPAVAVLGAPGTEPPSPIGAGVAPRSLAIVRLAADGRAVPDAPHRFKAGERIRLRVTPSHDAHVYCYMQDEARRVMRFYPNRFNSNARVTAAAPLEIPGPMRFEIVANARQVPETIACFASERDVLAELPKAVVGTDFEKLPAASLDQVRSAFARVSAAAPAAEARFEVRFK